MTSPSACGPESIAADDDAAAPRRRRWLRFLLGAALAPLVVVAAWLAGLVWFATTIPSGVADPDRATDAIVVLTGGANRLDEGFALLGGGKARKLFVSGVHPGVELPELLRRATPSPEWVQCCIVLGHEAADTHGNARETALWMRREGFRSLRLVTASYHMRRSLLELRRALPDAVIVPNPVFPERVHQRDWWARPGTAWLIATEYTKYLGALLRGLAPWPGAADSA